MPFLRLLPLLLAVLVLPAPARAVELGIQDDPLLVHGSPGYERVARGSWSSLDRADALLGELRVGWIRMNVAWARVADGDWSAYDAAVDRALARGRQVQMTLTGPAPAGATAGGEEGYRRPDPVAYGRFVAAAAERFRGRVARFSVWNEPNWHTFLRPARTATSQYRELYLAGEAAIRAAAPEAEVLIGELAPMGKAGASMSPLTFLRRLTCSRRSWAASARCPRLRADGFALHPYTLRQGPDFRGPGRDDVTSGSLGRLSGALTRLARRGALRTPAGRAPGLYLTEWGYHARSRAVPEPRRSRFIRRGLTRMARHPGVRQIVWYQLAAPPPRNGRLVWDTALIDREGRERRAFKTVRAWANARRSPVRTPG